jgi:hypothetical protein
MFGSRSKQDNTVIAISPHLYQKEINTVKIMDLIMLDLRFSQQ